jgi:hypothetical protein
MHGLLLKSWSCTSYYALVEPQGSHKSQTLQQLLLTLQLGPACPSLHIIVLDIHAVQTIPTACSTGACCCLT